MKILDVKNLSLSFKNSAGTINVLKNISFSLEKGKTVGIVGESGSGKSITALSILRLLPKNANITSGEINLSIDQGFVNLLELPEKEMLEYRGKHISMIFQEPMTSLNPSIKCGEQVRELITLHQKIALKDAKKKVIDLFAEVKLPDPQKMFNRYPHEISGGQKQRVMIAMAIALKPALIIADEPTTALDVTVQQSILDLLKQIQAKYGISIIFISHDLGVIANIADDILVMYQGRIVEKGSRNHILFSPEEPYSIGLLKCRPTLDTKSSRLPTVKDFLDNPDYNVSSYKIERNSIHQKEAVLNVRGLNKIYYSKRNLLGVYKDKYQAVKDFSFTIFKGETLGLVGESGCGKTTLGRMIAQLIDSSSGMIEYENLPLNHLKRKQLKEFRKNVQIIFQDPYSSLNPKLTIGEALTEPLIAHKLAKGNRKERVLEMLKKVKLDEDSFNKYPHEFSGGQRQRIVIARALILEPKLIICDESVSALDVSVQAEILNLLNDLKEEMNLTYLFISHDLSVVKYMSDRIMVMKDGTLVEINNADELYNSPASDYTLHLLDAIPEIKKD